jgi:hypothetical protein
MPNIERLYERERERESSCFLFAKVGFAILDSRARSSEGLLKLKLKGDHLTDLYGDRTKH